MLLKKYSALAFGVCLAACGSKTESSDPNVQISDLEIQIATPTEGGVDVSVTEPVLRATLNRPLDRPELMETVVLEDTQSLFVEGKKFYGSRKYSATNLDVVFTPFNIFQANREYTFVVRAEGVEASASFTTENAHAGPAPAVANNTYDLRLRELTYPSELAEVFNAQLDNAPPVLLHVVEMETISNEGGTEKSRVLVVSSTGRPGDPMGESAVLPEEEGHMTTTSVAMQGTVEGTWLGAGPFDLHTTASGVPLVIRELFITGIISPTGDGISQLSLTGVIDPLELGHALDLDLDFICTDEPFRQHCDEDGRLRVAGRLECALNPGLPFTAFLSSPVNASTGVPTDTVIEALFSDEIDTTGTTISVTAAGGASVSGAMEFDGQTARFVPAAPLASGTMFEVEVNGRSGSGATDLRHTVFTTE